MDEVLIVIVKLNDLNDILTRTSCVLTSDLLKIAILSQNTFFFFLFSFFSRFFVFFSRKPVNVTLVLYIRYQQYSIVDGQAASPPILSSFPRGRRSLHFQEGTNLLRQASKQQLGRDTTSFSVIKRCLEVLKLQQQRCRI
jgi:hypothetical protein